MNSQLNLADKFMILLLCICLSIQKASDIEQKIRKCELFERKKNRRFQFASSHKLSKLS